MLLRFSALRFYVLMALLAAPRKPVTVWIRDTKKFIRDVQSEMKKVTWPNGKEVIATTVIVIIAVFVFAAYLFVVDGIAFNAVNWIMRRFGATPPAA